MPDLIDFYEVFVLHVIAVRIAVPWFYKDVITACRFLFHFKVTVSVIITNLTKLSKSCSAIYDDINLVI